MTLKARKLSGTPQLMYLEKPSSKSLVFSCATVPQLTRDFSTTLIPVPTSSLIRATKLSRRQQRKLWLHHRLSTDWSWQRNRHSNYSVTTLSKFRWLIARSLKTQKSPPTNAEIWSICVLDLTFLPLRWLRLSKSWKIRLLTGSVMHKMTAYNVFMVFHIPVKTQTFNG